MKKIFLYASLNAYFRESFKNPINRTILAQSKFDMSEYKRLDEVPNDFTRRRLNILVSKNDNNLTITKGALSLIFLRSAP